MPYPSVEQFKAILKTLPLENIVQKYIFDGLPFVFRNQPETFDYLQNCIGHDLELQIQNVAVVGSARIGFSLNPGSFFRAFSPESDIDVIVIDEKLFDELWITILKWHYPQRYSGLEGADRYWAGKRKKEVYWGWITPDKIRFDGLSFPKSLKRLRDISTQWFNAFRSLSHHSELAARPVSGRLYRTWRHALLYHMEGLRQIKVQLL